MTRLTLFALLLVAACGSDNSALYLIEPPTGAEAVRVRATTIEVRDVTLPAYAAASDIAYQTEDGSLRTVPGALWAEDPARAVTAQVARALDASTTAAVSTEPWPLVDGPDLRLDIRIDRMVALADGRFEVSGQYAASSPDGAGRGILERFTIAVPLEGEGPGPIAKATGQALSDLTSRIAQRLSR